MDNGSSIEMEGRGKVISLKLLMDAIYNNDTDKCCELLSEINARHVNHAVRLKYPGYIGYTVTPLIWAVMNGFHDIVKVLLLHHAKVDKVGTYENNLTLYTTSPLIEAIKNSDRIMVKLLVEKGAAVQVGVPGPRLEEEEGGSIQYNAHLIPINISLEKSFAMFRCLLEHADLRLEYGYGKHTCLCYALSHYLSSETLADIQYVQEVLRQGGTFCRGKGDDSSLTGNGICQHIQKLIWKIVPPILMVNEANWSFNFEYFHCFKLVCCTDYSHESSQLYRVCLSCKQECRNYLAKALPVDENDSVNECLLYMIRYSERPSSLQHICRVAIRNLVKPFSSQQCRRLSLADDLLKYIILDEF